MAGQEKSPGSCFDLNENSPSNQTTESDPTGNDPNITLLESPELIAPTPVLSSDFHPNENHTENDAGQAEATGEENYSLESKADGDNNNNPSPAFLLGGDGQNTRSADGYNEFRQNGTTSACSCKPRKPDKRLGLSSKYSLSIAKKCRTLIRPLFQTVNVSYVFGGFLTPATVINKRSPKVKFAPEIVQVADLKKDVAGKERVVPRSNKPKRKGFRKVIDSSGNIICNPNEEAFEMYGAWYIVSDTDCPCTIGGCFSARKARPSRSISQSLSRNYRVQAENFSVSLEQAGNYFDGNLLTAKGAAEVFYFPSFNPVTEGLNCPASKIWIFTYALTSLFHDGQPTDEEFQQLVRHFYQIGQECEQVCDFVSAYSDIQLDLEQRITRLLSKILLRLRIRFKAGKKHTNVMAKNIWRKRMLKLSQTAKTIRDNDIAIMMGGIWNEPDLKWGNFKGYPLSFRIQALQSLLNDVEQSIRVIQSQIRFLSEDIKGGKFEEDDVHILSLLIVMDSVLKFFVNSRETTVTHEKNLRQVIRSFVRDTYDFFHTAHFAVAKTLELRDTMQLCHAYISKHYRSTVASFKTLDKEYSEVQRCCDWMLRRQYEYKEEDFFRTPFQRVLQMFYVSSGRAFIMLKYEKNEKESIEKIRAVSTIGDDDEDNARIRLLESIFSSDSAQSNLTMNTQSPEDVHDGNNSGSG